MAIRLNRNQLLELIGAIEDNGGDASQLKQELELLGPEQDSRPRTRGRGLRYRDEEEPTTAERLNHRVGDLFDGGVNDNLLTRLIELDGTYSLKELKSMCIVAGMSGGGDKKELCAKLLARGIL
jgi:hypothetical protein